MLLRVSKSLLCLLLGWIILCPCTAKSETTVSQAEEASMPGGGSVTPSCPIYQLKFALDMDHWWDTGGFIAGPNSSPECLSGVFTDVTKECNKRITEWWALDDCVAMSLVSSSAARRCYREELGISIPSPKWTAAATTTTSDPYCGRNVLYEQATVYLNGECQSISSPSDADTAAACAVGTYQWLYSPISLLWEDTADLEEGMTIASFPLDPGRPSGWYLWKASDKAPLLVYDPARTKRITSAFQLFGKWAFGGKRMASAKQRPDEAQPWENGFQALSFLDRDGDRKLSGPELEPLALWFDADRDGVSQENEVKTLDEAGVVNIYFTPDREDKVTGSVYADRGYDRIVDGRSVTGTAVDWFTDGADSRSQLISKLFAQSTGVEMMKPGIGEPDVKPPVQAPPTKAVDMRTNVSGLWQWSVEKKALADAKRDKPPQGYFTFSDKGDGLITGHSYLEIPFDKDRAPNAKRMVVMHTFKGTKEVNASGQVVLTFTLTTKEGTVIRNRAVMSADGRQLINATSTASAAYNGKPGSVTYSWTASRS